MTPLLAGSSMFMLLIIVAAFLLLTTLGQRPLKKQAQQQAEMRNAVTEGTRVMLTSGLFGTVTHVGTSQVIVELAPGVEVTAMKDAIAKVVSAEDEEFEFDEDADDAVLGHSDETEQVVPAPAAAAPAAQGTGATAAPLGADTDAATMTNAEPGTEQELGYPEHPAR